VRLTLASEVHGTEWIVRLNRFSNYYFSIVIREFNFEVQRKSFFSADAVISLTPGFSQVIAAQPEMRNRLNGFRIGCVFRFTWLKPGVN